MNRIRLIVSIILALVVVAIGALAVFPPKEFVKGRFAAEVKAATGRELAVKGATSLRLLPSFVLRVENVELQNPPGATGTPLFAAHSVLLESSLWAIITGTNVFDRVSVEGPRVALATGCTPKPTRERSSMSSRHDRIVSMTVSFHMRPPSRKPDAMKKVAVMPSRFRTGRATVTLSA